MQRSVKGLNHGSKAFGELLAVHDDLNEETIETIHKQCRCILILMEEYFLLAHFICPREDSYGHQQD